VSRRLIITIIASSAVLVSVQSAQAQVSSFFTATLNGLQEVPPNASPATGMGTFTLNPSQTSLSFNITYSGLTSAFVAAHFHNAAPGVNGPIVRGMVIGPDGPGGSPNGSFTGVWTSADSQPLTPALVTELFAGNIYFNVHTVNFGGGEIRGQLVLVPEPTSLALVGVGLAGVAWRRPWRRRKT
jgi:hypothetical protein